MELLNSNNFLHWRENMHMHLLELFGSLGHVVVNDNYIVPNIDNLQESSVTTTENGVTTTIRSDLIKAQSTYTLTTSYAHSEIKRKWKESTPIFTVKSAQ